MISQQYRPLTLSDYWQTMSMGIFDVIGDVFPYPITLRPESYYRINSKDWQDANRDVIDSIDGKIDFKRYENWGMNYTTQNFYFSPRNADSYLDMMYIIYRNPGKDWFGHFDGIAGLSWSSVFSYTTRDSVIIQGGLSELGSGITIARGAGMAYPDFLTKLLCHELGHYFFGFGHIMYSGIMSEVEDQHTSFLCSWERERLGYISFTTAYQNNFTISLGDYITTGQVLKVPILNDPNMFFLIENHQRLNRYDQIIRGGPLQGAFDTSTTVGKGIYIWLVRGGDTYPLFIDPITASGNWVWQYDGDYYAGPGWYVGQPYEGWLPKTKRIQIDRHNGKNDKYTNHVHWNDKWRPKWVDINPLTKEYEITRNCMGMPEHAFNLNYNNLFTPWSNPSTHVNIYNNIVATNISIQLVSQFGNFITIKVYNTLSSGINLPPSKPQFLRVTAVNGYAHLSWEQNIEPDMQYSGKYKIYRTSTSGGQPGTFYHIATINAYNGTTPVTSWIDHDPHVGSGSLKLFYKISAVDNENNESVLSDYDWVAWDGSLKKMGLDSKTTINNYQLYNNYPNPFNSTTVIRYDIKEKGFVELKIYDVLGNEIKTLVNEYKETGSYSTIFDAHLLPSGIYFYRIRAGTFTSIKKLIIIK